MRNQFDVLSSRFRLCTSGFTGWPCALPARKLPIPLSRSALIQVNCSPSAFLISPTGTPRHGGRPANDCVCTWNNDAVQLPLCIEYCCLQLAHVISFSIVAVPVRLQLLPQCCAPSSCMMHIANEVDYWLPQRWHLTCAASHDLQKQSWRPRPLRRRWPARPSPRRRVARRAARSGPLSPGRSISTRSVVPAAC